MGWDCLGLSFIQEASNAFDVYTCLVYQGIMVKGIESDL